MPGPTRPHRRTTAPTARLEDAVTAPVERRPAAGGRPALEIHRSARRRRTASAAADGPVMVLRLPAGLPEAEEEQLIVRLVDRTTGTTLAAARGGDAALEARAAELADRHLDGVRATSVRWSGRMRRRHGSCTPATGAIRISRLLAGAPDHVLDHVLLHELAHLRVADHSQTFQELLDRDPHRARAEGWLAGYAAGRLAAGVPDDGPDPPPPVC
jgi:hypothetical protein